MELVAQSFVARAGTRAEEEETDVEAEIDEMRRDVERRIRGMLAAQEAEQRAAQSGGAGEPEADENDAAAHND